MTDTSVLLDEAFAKHQAGLVSDARSLYEQVLNHGDNAEAFHWLGILELQAGEPGKAIAWLKQASAMEPANAQVLANLGNACFAASQSADAIDAYRQSLSLNPASPETLASLGNLFFATGKPDEAIDSYKKALTLNPSLAEVWRGLASAFLEKGEHANALEAVERAEQEHRGASSGVSLPIVMTRGNILVGAGLTKEALACFEQVVEQAPAFSQARMSMGGAYRVLGRLDEAREHCEKAITLDPANPAGYYALGLVHMDNGDMQLATKEFERTLAADPLHGRAHRLIASLTKHTLDHPNIARMRQALANDAASAVQRTHLHFGLGKALEDVDLFDMAFAQIEQGNRLHRQRTTYSIDYDQELMEQTARLYTSGWLTDNAAKPGVSGANSKPVFIVGMPRSGTSLIEQILASHPDVYGAGELDLVERCTESVLRNRGLPVGEFESLKQLEQADKSVFTEIGRDYLSRITALAKGRPFVVDKMPANFLHVGLIRCAIPEAIVIHARRHPMATCWSVYKNYFGAQGHAYSFDQNELGRYYTFYEKLMAHWNKVVGGGIYVVDYEELVVDQESVSRSLLAHCGLPWNAACLEFHKNKRAVRTLSASQVRTPLYRGSVAQWKHYVSHLDPLFKALGHTE